MALETGTYISDLVTTNPPNTDGVSQADDHLRLIKSTVKATFPNITGAVTLTQAQLNAAARTNAANTFTDTQTINGASLLLNANSDYTPQTQLTHAGATAGSGAYSILNRARGTYGSPTIVSSGDQLGNVLFQGYDGSAYRSAASIEAQVDGTPGANDMPGRLTFKTTPDGGTAATERMRITSAGDVGIGTSAITSKLLVSSSSGDAPNGLSGKCVARFQSTQTAAVGVGPSLLFEGQTGNTTANYAFAGIQGFKANATAGDYTGSLAFFTQNAGGASALTEQMRIDGVSGSVGIGTTTSLGTYGKLRVGGTGYQALNVGSDDATGVNVIVAANAASEARIGTVSNHPVDIYTNGVARMRIDGTGAVTIGGNPVISSAGTAAQGDVLYHNGTAWTRLAAGTSGQVLKTNGAGANPSWVTPTVGGMTLLATLATTSGASVPSGTLNLTPYRKLFISFVGISAANSSAVLSLNGVNIITLGTAPATQNLWVELDLNSGIGYRCAASGITGDAYGIINGTTSFSVAVASTTFDAGSVQIYGIA